MKISRRLDARPLRKSYDVLGNMAYARLGDPLWQRDLKEAFSAL